MAARTAVLRLSTRRVPVYQLPALASQTVKAYRGRRQYYRSPNHQNEMSKQPNRSEAQNPIAASMAESTSPTGNNAGVQADETRNAAFLGEADSDDAFEADIEVNPEAHRHKFDDVSASGLHGQSGEGDEPIERERKPYESVDASQSAFLGEADSNDAHEADKEINPEKYRHHIQDSTNAAFLGEADSDDAHEVDREANPEKYRHRIDDPYVSGSHGESGEGDTPMERT